ncbi:alpha/beta hydrolase-fold protein [Curtobacterium sp. MCSS17_007]|uniref:alpha/beta hydrolase n=1 Tax=Curtobacterium sp. MCSS17_007 TaxID=2175646 RepID=UPI0011B6FEFC|nr:alpha/beta hydrolase-fold protein [Curtobacterium sp. MCSS17_007]WIE75991.1 alpha/beta hydrolase-fold protein [Curtobacterium sp. MCSS17_007]
MSPTEWLLATQLQAPSKLVPADTAFVVLALVVLLPAVRQWRSPTAWRRVVTRAAIAGAAALVLLAVCWFLTHVVDLFGVALSPVTQMWTAFAAAGLALAVTGLVQGGRWRRTVAVLLVPATLVVPALGVNVEFGKYPTLGTVVQSDPFPALDLDAVPSATMPSAGVVRTVEIPGRRSHFDARPAVVWLPPAALVRDPRPLPVVIAFSGQPGAPGDLFTAGRLAEPLDAYAAAHEGRAPIVVSVDQLSAPGRNPMCVDSALGNVATYVTRDVPDWLTTHLPVTTDHRAWGLTGFSQGATCAMQFVTGHPDEFGAALAVSSELQPIDQGPQHSADQAFGGSTARWRAAAPIAQMRANGLGGHALWLTAGSADREFSENARKLGAAARKAGARVEVGSAPGSGHDWNTVQWSFRSYVGPLADALSAADR